MSNTTTIRIVPPEPSEIGLVRTQGTRVLTQDGRELTGVYGITLHCEVNDIWRAHLRVNPEVCNLDGILATWEPVQRQTWFRRLLGKICRRAVDVTSLDSLARTYR